MSVDFTQPISLASIPDASESLKGKIRIATSAEATAGTDDLTAMTPLKVQSVVNTALVGGVTYQGTLDASAPADLSNASKGDLYIISVAGTYQGQSWAVGDHLLINADMGGTLDPAKIDKVDNTDAVTSVAGRTGAVTLSTADVSGLATVASTGAYSDLSGTPTLGTASAEDVGTSAGNVVQLDGSARLPAVDGSQLTNLPAPTLELNDLTDVTFTAGAGIDNYVLTFNNSTGLWGAEAVPSAPKSFYAFGTINVSYTAPAISDNRCQYYYLATGGITLTIPSASSSNAIGGLIIVRNTSTSTVSVICPSANLADGTTATTFDLEPEEARSFVWLSTTALHEISASSLGQLTNVDLSGLANGDVLIYNSTSGKWEAGSTPAASVALDDLTDVTITAASTGEVLRYNGAEWVDAQLAYSDLSGTPTLGTASAEDVGTSAGNVVQLDGSARLPAVDGSQLTNLPGDDAFYITSVSSTSTAAQISDNRHQTYRITQAGVTLTLQNASGTPTTSPAIGGIVTLINTSSGSVTIASPAGGLGPFYVLASGSVQSFTLEAGARISFVWASGNSLVERAVSTLNGLSDVTITAASTGEVLRYDGAEWVDAQLAYSDLSGAPTNVSSFTNDAGYISDITAENLGDLADVDLTGLADGEIIIYNATSGKWEANPPPAPQATTTSVGLIEIAENAEATAGTATDKALVPSNISSITTAQLDNSAGTMLESANNLSDLANAATARTNLGLGSSAVLDAGTSANNVVQLNGSAQLPAIDGSLLTGVVADISGASVGDLSDVTITAAASGEVLRYNGTAWVDAQLDYADITGLGTAAPLDAGTSANNVVQLNGSAQLPALDGSLLTGVVADISGASLSDLSDVSYPASPTADQLLQWNSTTSKWEPVDATTLTSASPGSTYSITTHKGLEEVHLLTPSVNCTVSIPTASTAGAGFKYNIKNLSANTITINATIDGTSGLDLTTQYSCVTIVSDGTNWYVI